jgi:hypothetical protein
VLIAAQDQPLGNRNRAPLVRDVTSDEDRSQVRTGSGPQVMAGLRNLAITILRLAGHASIAAAVRYHLRWPRQTPANDHELLANDPAGPGCPRPVQP